jgi:hypothetical protein
VGNADHLTADDAAALRRSVRASITRLGDAARVAADIGALDLLAEDLPALAIFFEEFGRHHLVTTLTDTLVGHALGIEDAAVAYALPECGLIDAPAAIRSPAGLRIDAVLRVPAGLPSHAVVPLEGGAVVAPLSHMQTAPAAGFDIGGGWHHIRGDLREDTLTTIGTGDWSRALAITRLAFGSELLGLATQISAIAVAHVTSRHQFGKPLGSFQTVRHRLAEAHVAIEAAQTILDLAWAAAAKNASSAGEVGIYAIAAKAMAGRAFEVSARTATQLCGGIGLTWEHPLPGFVRRGSALNVLLGEPTDLTATIGSALCDAVVLPAPDPLTTPNEHVGAR